MTNRSKIILGLLAAAAAGTAIGVLTAPANGRLLRKKIATRPGNSPHYLYNLLGVNGKDKAYIPTREEIT